MTASTLEPLACLADFEKAARRTMPGMTYEYVSGGAGDEHTLAWNEHAWNELRLRSRILVDVSRLDTTVHLLGRGLAHPILLAPTAYQKLVHPDGELATVRGAGAAGAATIVSSFSNVSIEELARAAAAPLWFQLYVQPDRGFTRAGGARRGRGMRGAVRDGGHAGARRAEPRDAHRLRAP